MAPERASRLKTQTLSLRLDPKTRFILEFMSRVKGQSITVVVERAIKESADKVGIGPTYDSRGNEIPQSVWTEFWDADEGIRMLKLLAFPDYSTTYEEDEIRRFTLDHWDFFYTEESGKNVRRGYACLLWPNISKYIKTWQSTRTENYWAAGNQMAEDLSRAGVKAPIWPRESTPKAKTTSSFARDLDDEVPF